MEPVADLEELIERSAAPDAVRLAIERLADAHPDLPDRLRADLVLAAAVVATTAASRSLTQLLETSPAALDTLAALDQRPTAELGDAESLVTWKRLEFLRIAARDLLDLDLLEVSAAALASLATDVLVVACRIAGAEELAVIGMGKLGGNELNYASDIDIIFVGQSNDRSNADAGERRARAVMDLARRCFRVDTNLRPEGRSGPLVRSVESYVAYWDRWAEPWEFQALLKARPAAGDTGLATRWADAAAEHLWGTPFGADELRSVRAMKARAEAEVARQGLTDREVKRGRGGIRDIEFSVQLLQLVHGSRDADLRSPTTLDALTELASAGYVAIDDADRLAAAYRFLRRVEHRLQLEDERQVHLLPTDDAARGRLARVLGFRATPGASALEGLDAEVRRHQTAVRVIHEQVWFRPLLEAFARTDAALGPEAAATRLAAFGFTDAERTRQAVTELTRGLTRSSRLMQQTMGLLLDWLSTSPDPDLGLLGLRKLASGHQRNTELATAFRDSPEVARRLCQLLGTSRMLGGLLEHNPDLIADLGRTESMRLRVGDELLEGTRKALSWRGETEDRQRALKRFTDREGLRIAANDVLELSPLADIGQALTTLAESALSAALEALEPALPFAVVALGRFGGGELSYASDLDVVFVYDGSGTGDFEEAERLATALLRFLGGSSPATTIYDVDTDLRPEGRQGPLARSLHGFRTYYERWAETWERQAMVRARAVAGDASVGQGLIDVIEPFVWDRELTREDERAIRRMKARVERERVPAGEDPEFHLKLGPGSLSDVEFTAQLLQLRHGVRSTGTAAALERLVEQGVLEADDGAVLAEAYRFCEHTRNRLFLVNSARGDSLPRQPAELGRLARALDTTPAVLRDEYRRVTRRARRVVERVFYDQA
ncbi:bifunctional [glutamine synthetase] adenylyltransferase/[glutamine synthetase]-adenylyl-L-tyrosine phosphorylase [soil metagenome]